MNAARELLIKIKSLFDPHGTLRHPADTSGASLSSQWGADGRIRSQDDMKREAAAAAEAANGVMAESLETMRGITKRLDEVKTLIKNNRETD